MAAELAELVVGHSAAVGAVVCHPGGADARRLDRADIGLGDTEHDVAVGYPMLPAANLIQGLDQVPEVPACGEEEKEGTEPE